MAALERTLIECHPVTEEDRQRVPDITKIEGKVRNHASRLLSGIEREVQESTALLRAELMLVLAADSVLISVNRDESSVDEGSVHVKVIQDGLVSNWFGFEFSSSNSQISA